VRRQEPGKTEGKKKRRRDRAIIGYTKAVGLKAGKGAGTMKTGKFIGVIARKQRPTKKHRRAVWENMLGTVYAMNDQGETRYFDYDWDGALAWAGVTDDRDPRLYRETTRHWTDHFTSPTPRVGQLVLWITEQAA